MGHRCRICGRVRANEQFSGRGHRVHACRDCQRRPGAERERIEQLDELYGFIEQSNISAKNIERLKILCDAAEAGVRELAAVVLDVARAHPRKRRRWKYLVGQRRDLLVRLKAVLGEDWIEEALCEADIVCPWDQDQIHAGFDDSRRQTHDGRNRAETGDIPF